jgi:nitroimidazol reductase NimA-like FMN-containing flavoprotein (pyridoxamine 5'-phosphate oxidase superfamily)
MGVTMTPESGPAPFLEELSPERCLDLLRHATVGRIAFLMDEHPMVLPVNYRLAETNTATWIAIRTRAGGSISRAPMKVAFEIDGVDHVRKQGWSVVVRGMLEAVDPDAADFGAHFDSEPWLQERDAWFVIEPFAISGREVHHAGDEWAFHIGSYL